MSNSNNSCTPRQHNHEILGSVQISGYREYAHNHRFATVSSEAIPCEGSHVHEIRFTTDSCNGHHHEFRGTSSPAIEVGCGKHVHFAKATTSTDARHEHDFVVASLIEDPVCEK